MPKRSRKSRNNGSSAAAAAAVAMAGPPQHLQGPRTGDVFRYQSSTAISSSVDITWGCLRNLYFTTITSSTANTMFAAIKLKKVEVWVPPSGATTTAAFALPVTIRFREGDGAIGQEKVISDIVTSTAGAHLKVKFSESKTDMGKWRMTSAITNSDICFSIINLPAGSVIDLTMSWQGWATGSSVVGLTCAALTAGRIYRNCLDNTDSSSAIGGALLLPAGVVGSTGIAYG